MHLIPLLFISFGSLPLVAEVLSLTDYQAQVEQGNLTISASSAQSKSAQNKKIQNDIDLGPTVSVTTNYTDTQKPPSSVFGAGETKLLGANVEYKQILDIGFMLKATAGTTSMNMSKIPTVPPAFASVFHTPEKLYSTTGSLEASMPLWKNFLGKDIQRGKEILKLQGDITELSEGFRRDMTLLEAEVVYVRLSLATEVVKAQEAVLERQKRLRDWVKERTQNNLADQADLLQAEVAVKARELELEGARDELRAAGRAFNTLRGLDADTVKESLRPIASLGANNIKPISAMSSRKDVRAAKTAADIAETAYLLAQDKYDPQLNLFTSLSSDSSELTQSDSFSNTTKAKHPTLTIGVNFQMPLSMGLIHSHRETAQSEKVASDMTYQRKLFEEVRSWQDLTENLKDAKRRLELAEAVADLQKSRLEAERKRHGSGRSTLSQVLSSEQDAAQATVGLLRAHADVLRIYANMKTYKGS